MDVSRPDPEQLLQQLKEEEGSHVGGKLKIYLGAAPGVGKTYAMLEDAKVKQAQGVDVVAGIIESHGRKDIENLLAGLQVLPFQTVQYRDKQFKEFDLDGALKRNPNLILLDEMAHSNVPGLRHAKRWQDVKELLDRGINVYTTLNVQHIESLNDIVSQIINTNIKETVPDSILELAETIELIDLPPEDLLKRLQEGKIYFASQAELAQSNFFRKGNLIALRELALRITAERVGAQASSYKYGRGIKQVWHTKEKILVCVNHTVGTGKLIRIAKRIATSMQAEWIALYVDVPAISDDEQQRNAAIENLRLAEKLGAVTRTLPGTDIVKEVINFARAQNITQIMLWKQIRPWWQELFTNRISNQIIRQSEEIGVYLVTGTEKPKANQTSKPKVKAQNIWQPYAIGLGIIALTLLITFFLAPLVVSSNLLLLNMLGLIIVALFGWGGVTITACIVDLLAYDFLFNQPRFSFGISNLQDFLVLLVMLVIVQLVSYLTIRDKKQVEIAKFSEQHAMALHTLSNQLSTTRGVDKLLSNAARYIAEAFDCTVVALLPRYGNVEPVISYNTRIDISEKDKGIAEWVYNMGQIAGLGTDTLPFSDSIYIPMLTAKEVVGVLRICPLHQEQLSTPERLRLLESCASQIALALEVDRLEEQTKRSELLMRTDRIRNKLLQSISYELRIPLVAAINTVSELMAVDNEGDIVKIKKLSKNVNLRLRHLRHLIIKLLQITSLESETVKLNKEPHALEEVIANVVKRIGNKLGKHSLHIDIPKDLPKIPFDAALIQTVFINLLDNAIKFTDQEVKIEISALIKDSSAVIVVADRGRGVVPEEINKLFNKFYRGKTTLASGGLGLGLGLSICRNIIKVHGGKIWAENRDGGGVVFYFTLPLK